MFNTFEDYLRVLHGQGVTRHTLAVQSCDAVVTVELRPTPDSGLRIECGVDGCRCWPIAWEGSTDLRGNTDGSV